MGKIEQVSSGQFKPKTWVEYQAQFDYDTELQDTLFVLSLVHLLVDLL